MSIIKVDNLTFSYGYAYQKIFDKCSFVIDTDWKLGFIGRNGKGKTTFLKLLMGEYQYQGHIISSVPFDYFPYEVADKNNTVENIVSQIAPFCEQWQFVKELYALQLQEDILNRTFATLSSGEQTKVLLALLFVNQNKFHLIDEPTNHLDLQTRKVVAQYLKAKKGFVLVSHDRAFLDSCVDHILSLNRHTIEVQKGNYTSWKANFDNRQQHEQQQNNTLQKDIKQLQQAIKRTRQWADIIEASKIGQGAGDRGYIGHQSARMMQRAKATESRQRRAIEQKQALLKDMENTESLKLHPLRYVAKRLARLENVAVRYGTKTVCNPVTFDVTNGDRIALCGTNGSGKSSIIKLLLGRDIDYGGTVSLSNNVVVSYVPQDTSFLQGSLFDFARQNGVDLTLFLTILRKLDFEREQFDKDMSQYSLGQKKKVLIANSLSQQAHLYIWDEPLNYIDIYSRVQIEQLLLQYPSTMVFVEHDSQFVNNIATKIVNVNKRSH